MREPPKAARVRRFVAQLEQRILRDGMMHKADRHSEIIQGYDALGDEDPH
jgi:hypothetical protein